MKDYIKLENDLKIIIALLNKYLVWYRKIFKYK